MDLISAKKTYSTIRALQGFSNCSNVAKSTGDLKDTLLKRKMLEHVSKPTLDERLLSLSYSEVS